MGAADAWEAAEALAGRCVGAADAWEAAAAGGGSTGGALRRGCRCVGSGGGTGRVLRRGCRCVGSGGGSEEDAGTRFRAKLASKRGKMRKNSFVGAKPYWSNGSSYFSCSVANKRPMDGQAKSQGQLNGEMAAEYSCPLLEAALGLRPSINEDMIFFSRVVGRKKKLR